MLGPFHVQGAAESDAPVRLGVRAHVPGTRRDRAQADEERIKKGLAVVETPSEGIRLWAVFKKRVRPMARFRRTPERDARLLGSWSCGQDVRSVSPLEPPSCSARIPGNRCVYRFADTSGESGKESGFRRQRDTSRAVARRRRNSDASAHANL
jgi:hypothetical protein